MAQCPACCNRIIEGANLLMMPGREAAPPGAKSEAPGVELEPPEITVLVRKNRASFDALRDRCRLSARRRYVRATRRIPLRC